jgi:hypothetical protein
MRIEVKQMELRETAKYPYTHRVQVDCDALASDKISEWLRESNIPHVQTGWGIFYLNGSNTEWLMLRWS